MAAAELIAEKTAQKTNNSSKESNAQTNQNSRISFDKIDETTTRVTVEKEDGSKGSIELLTIPERVLDLLGLA